MGIRKAILKIRSEKFNFEKYMMNTFGNYYVTSYRSVYVNTHIIIFIYYPVNEVSFYTTLVLVKK